MEQAALRRIWCTTACRTLAQQYLKARSAVLHTYVRGHNSLQRCTTYAAYSRREPQLGLYIPL